MGVFYSNRNKAILSGGAILLVLVLLLYGCSGANSLTAVEIRLQRMVGNVTMTDSNGKERTPMEEMRFNSGDHVATQEDSLITMALDETKLVTLEESTNATINADGSHLSVVVEDGNFYFNVTEKLADGESFDISTSNMVCGVRGTSAYGGEDENGNDLIMATDGNLHLVHVDGTTGKEITQIVYPGQKAVLDIRQETPGFNVQPYTVEDLPPLALDSICKNDELCQRVVEATGFPEKKIEALAEATCVPGINSEGNPESIPLMGQAARDIVEVVKQAAELSEDNLELEAAIVKGVRDVIVTGKENGLNDEELSNTVKKSAECVCNTVKTAKDNGVSGDDLVTITEAVSETLVSSVDAMTTSNLSQNEMDQVMDAVTEVYEQAVTVAAAEAKENGGDVGSAVVSSVNNTSENVDKSVKNEMSKSSTGEETAEVIAGMSDNTQTQTTTTQTQQTTQQTTRRTQTTQTTTQTTPATQTTTQTTPAATVAQTTTTPAAATASAPSTSSTTQSDTTPATDPTPSTENDPVDPNQNDPVDPNQNDPVQEEPIIEEPEETTGTITYVLNGGEFVSDPDTVYTYGVGMTLPTASDVERDQTDTYTYVFDGWYTEATGGTLVTMIGTEATGPKTYYAHWTQITRIYDVSTATLGGGTDCSVTATMDGGNISEAPVGSTVTLTATPGTDCHFVKWIDENANMGTVADSTDATVTFEMPAGDVSAKAEFAYNTYSVTIDSEHITNGTVTISGTQTEFRAGTTVTLTIDPDDNYELNEIVVLAGSTPVALSGTGNTRTFTMPAGSVRVSASFEPIDYAISVATSEYGTATANKQTANYGDTVTITISPNAHYELESISGSASTGSNQAVELEFSGTGNTRTFTMPGGDVRILVTFKATTYGVAVETVEGGTVVADKSSAAAGETVTLTATPAANYDFTEFTVSGSDSSIAYPEIELNVDEDNPNIATFTMPAGSVSVSGSFTRHSDTLSWGALRNSDSDIGLGYLTSVTIGNSTENLVGGSTTSAQVDAGETVKLTITRYEGKIISKLCLTGIDESADPIYVDLTLHHTPRQLGDNGINDYYTAEFAMPAHYTNIDANQGNNQFTVTVVASNAYVYAENSGDPTTGGGPNTIESPFTCTADSEVRLEVEPMENYWFDDEDTCVYYIVEGSTEKVNCYNDGMCIFYMPPKNITLYVIAKEMQ